MALISHENNKRNLTIWLKEGDFLTNTIPVLEFPHKDLNLAIDPPVEKRVRESVLPVLVKKPNYTSPSSVDDGGNEDDRELDKKDNEAVKVILSGHRDLVINLGQKLFYSNTLLIVTSYDEAYAKINLTIRNHFNG